MAHINTSIGGLFDGLRKWLPTTLLCFTLIGGAWTEYFSDGIQNKVQNYVGISEIREDVAELKQYIEPPDVLIWDHVRQVGICTIDACPVVASFHRTDYGATCGKPDVTFELRINRSRTTETTARNFQPIEGTVTGNSVGLDLVIPAFIAEGVHEWRTISNYPTCAFSGEPLPRYSPWWPLTIS